MAEAHQALSTKDQALVNRLHHRAEEQRRLFLGGGPAVLAVGALPAHVELDIDHGHRLRALAAGAADAVLVEDLVDGHASLHDQVVGRGP